MALTFRNWWRAPFWAAQLATGAKSFVDNPILGSPALNRRGLHAARLKLAHRLASSRRARLTLGLDKADRAAFDRDGFVRIPDFLPAEEFAKLRRYLLESAFEAREHRQGDTVTRRVPVDGDMLRQCPELQKLLHSRRWISLMRYVASTGGEPLYYLQSIVTGFHGPPDPQLELHCDAFHPALKAWFYLTDVNPDGAPLTYVPGSHRLTSRRLQWERDRSVSVVAEGDRLSQRGSLRIGKDELAGLGLPDPVAIAAPANTLIVADTYGFHARGPAADPIVRVELWAYLRRSPFLPWTGFDFLSAGPIAARRAGWVYRILDALDARGLRQQHWKPSGWKRALDR